MAGRRPPTEAAAPRRSGDLGDDSSRLLNHLLEHLHVDSRTNKAPSPAAALQQGIRGACLRIVRSAAALQAQQLTQRSSRRPFGRVGLGVQLLTDFWRRLAFATLGLLSPADPHRLLPRLRG